jgi:hypothetical protein
MAIKVSHIISCKVILSPPQGLNDGKGPTYCIMRWKKHLKACKKKKRQKVLQYGEWSLYRILKLASQTQSFEIWKMVIKIEIRNQPLRRRFYNMENGHKG